MKKYNETIPRDVYDMNIIIDGMFEMYEILDS